MGSRVRIILTARLRPLDRGTLCETPLREVPDAGAPGSRVTGAGTLLSAEREPVVSDIDVDVEGNASGILELMTAALEVAGAPKGSRARLDQGDPCDSASPKGSRSTSTRQRDFSEETRTGGPARSAANPCVFGTGWS